jgi:hypothetical protein
MLIRAWLGDSMDNDGLETFTLHYAEISTKRACSRGPHVNLTAKCEIIEVGEDHFSEGFAVFLAVFSGSIPIFGIFGAEETSGRDVFHDFREAGRPIFEENIIVPIVANTADFAAEAVAFAFELPPGAFLGPELVDGAGRDGEGLSG